MLKIRHVLIGIAPFAALLHMAGPASAQGVPTSHDFMQLNFFSAPTTLADGRIQAFYKVCNSSDRGRAFRWYGPDFGISSLAELQPKDCVFRMDDLDGQSHQIYDSRVTLVGDDTDDGVPVWIAERPRNWFLSQIMTRITEADGSAPMEAISITTIRNGDGSGEIRITGSGYFNNLVIILPDADTVELASEVSSNFRNGSAEVQTVSQRQDLATSGLADDIDGFGDSTAIIDINGDEGITGVLTIKVMDTLGKRALIFAGGSQGAAIRSNIQLPTGSQ